MRCVHVLSAASNYCAVELANVFQKGGENVLEAEPLRARCLVDEQALRCMR
jgi:hypothetical protein